MYIAARLQGVGFTGAVRLALATVVGLVGIASWPNLAAAFDAMDSLGRIAQHFEAVREASDDVEVRQQRLDGAMAEWRRLLKEEISALERGRSGLLTTLVKAAQDLHDGAYGLKEEPVPPNGQEGATSAPKSGSAAGPKKASAEVIEHAMSVATRALHMADYFKRRPDLGERSEPKLIEGRELVSTGHIKYRPSILGRIRCQVVHYPDSSANKRNVPKEVDYFRGLTDTGRPVLRARASIKVSLPEEASSGEKPRARKKLKLSFEFVRGHANLAGAIASVKSGRHAIRAFLPPHASPDGTSSRCERMALWPSSQRGLRRIK